VPAGPGIQPDETGADVPSQIRPKLATPIDAGSGA
jgi:hypothetical protein